MTKMFCIFNLFAQKHNIFNWISHGTLLEAARHQGFIPWDVYSDIQIRLDDYVKFFQVLLQRRIYHQTIFFLNSVSDPAFPSNYFMFFFYTKNYGTQDYEIE